jgi:hypothetical protein
MTTTFYVDPLSDTVTSYLISIITVTVTFSAKNTMQQVPQEVLARIISYNVNDGDITRYQKINTQFHQVINSNNTGKLLCRESIVHSCSYQMPKSIKNKRNEFRRLLPKNIDSIRLCHFVNDCIHCIPYKKYQKMVYGKSSGICTDKVHKYYSEMEMVVTRCQAIHEDLLKYSTLDNQWKRAMELVCQFVCTCCVPVHIEASDKKSVKKRLNDSITYHCNQEGYFMRWIICPMVNIKSLQLLECELRGESGATYYPDTVHSLVNDIYIRQVNVPQSSIIQLLDIDPKYELDAWKLFLYLLFGEIRWHMFPVAVTDEESQLEFSYQELMSIDHILSTVQLTSNQSDY